MSDAADRARDGGDGASADRGAGGARMEAGSGQAERAVVGDAPLEAAARDFAPSVDGVRGAASAWFGALTDEERRMFGVFGAFAALFLVLVWSGSVTVAYAMNLTALAGMYVLLAMGLNVQWGYTGLINFSVAAFFGIGAYAAALLASADSPLTQGTLLVVDPPMMGPVDVLGGPVVGVFAAMLTAAVVAVLIGYPTLSLREDYLAIASLGLAEVVRIVIKNQQSVTGGVRGVLGMPSFLVEWPVVGDAVAEIPGPQRNAATVLVFVVGTWLFLRYVHRSPWGRAQRLVRSDEDLAEALGKNTFRLRMQSFVIGSVIMGLAGVFFVHINNSLFPGSLKPIKTFYVWVAVILGGTGSDRGSIVGGVLVVTIIQGTRFEAVHTFIAWLLGLVSMPPIDAGSLRLLVVGVVIILVMHFRQEGVLPPQRELIWPGAREGRRDE